MGCNRCSPNHRTRSLSVSLSLSLSLSLRRLVSCCAEGKNTAAPGSVNWVTITSHRHRYASSMRSSSLSSFAKSMPIKEAFMYAWPT